MWVSMIYETKNKQTHTHLYVFFFKSMAIIYSASVFASLWDWSLWFAPNSTIFSSCMLVYCFQYKITILINISQDRILANSFWENVSVP